VDFLLVITELFWLGVVSEATWSVWPKISGRKRRPPPNHSSCQKTKMIDLSYCIKVVRIFFRFITIHVFDRRTEGRTDGYLAHSYIAAA